MKLLELVKRLEFLHQMHGDIPVVLGASKFYTLASRIEVVEKPATEMVYITGEECH